MNFVPVVVEKADRLAQQGMPHAKSGGGELVRDAGVDRRVVPFVAAHAVSSQQRRQKLVVRDRLNLGDDPGPRPLVDLLVRPVGVLPGDFRGLKIVLADPECLHGRQNDILVDADVACDKGLVPRNVRRDSVGQRPFGKERRRVEGQQIPLARLQLAT